ncbi:MAG: right-handed parallel beta-helix repeat-containing protein [Candidatus Omnitrophica bacterium]|nr:right-handed parallel beta-helix repeat-containing protein [Candidatus Omnitrophota bacterium]
MSPGDDVQKRVQEELILAEPGTIIEFEEGVYEFTQGLSLDVEEVTVRGAGMDKTILDFKNQEAGAEGLYITSDHVLVEDLCVRDTKGNAIKSHSADNIIYRRVKTEWTGGPKPTNGAYGLYPVSSENVLIEGCVAIGASDSGIYVGQSKHVIVRDCTAKFNVAGIEIENCHFADVHDCLATENTGGILVFDLPDLPQQNGHNIRIFKNKSVENNTKNFAPEGNMVANVKTGTGVMVMANTNVEIFENMIGDNDATNIMVIAYQSTGLEIKDVNYYPFPETIHIHDNQFGPCGSDPGKEGGTAMEDLLGKPLPDIVWDGVVNEKKAKEGQLPEEIRLAIHDNSKTGGGDVTFGNLGGLDNFENPSKDLISRDLSAHAGEHPSIAAVRIEGVD